MDVGHVQDTKQCDSCNIIHPCKNMKKVKGRTSEVKYLCDPCTKVKVKYFSYFFRVFRFFFMVLSEISLMRVNDVIAKCSYRNQNNVVVYA